MWILILVSLQGSMATAEFTSLKLCEDAAKKTQKQFSVQTLCVYSGD